MEIMNMDNSEVQIAREVISDPKVTKATLIPLALSLGIVKSKRQGEKTLKAPLLGLIASKLAEIERELKRAECEKQAREQAERAPIVSPIVSSVNAPKRFANGAKDQREHRAAQARRRAKNRRKYRRALIRARHGWANGKAA